MKDCRSREAPTTAKLVCDPHIQEDQARAVGMDLRRYGDRDVDRDGRFHLVGLSIEPRRGTRYREYAAALRRRRRGFPPLRVACAFPSAGVPARGTEGGGETGG